MSDRQSRTVVYFLLFCLYSTSAYDILLVLVVFLLMERVPS